MLLLCAEYAFGVNSRLLFAFEFVSFDFLLTGTLFSGLGRLVTHNCAPCLKRVVQSGALQVEGHPSTKSTVAV